MKTIVAVAVMAVLVSIIAVSTLVVTGNIDAKTSGSDSVTAGSSGGKSAESVFYTAVCGPDVVHACQSSAGQ